MTKETKHMARTGWNDDALQTQYYRGLKDVVKDEIARTDESDNLQELIQLAIKIDDRLYKRSLEQRGQNNRMGNKNPRKNRWPEPMELDANRIGNLSKEEKDRRRKEGLCFECGKSGHRANIHRRKNDKKAQGRHQQLKATRFLPLEPVTPLQLTPEQEHACLS
ncbi:Zinc finger CCHC-type protein [Rutstroemia sp. NJR-2017a BBW]|nr:Zinc finger CCHC-type protein [Rutstroemia sp. NJR-2017a BBW]